MKTGIVICSRRDSKRLPDKCFEIINGKTILYWLVHRLLPSGLPIFVAIPKGDMEHYLTGLDELVSHDNVKVVYGDYYPMQRMSEVAKRNKLDNIIRICHDKIFVEPEMIKSFLEIFNRRNANDQTDYLSSNQFSDGSKFEIFTADILDEAIRKSKIKIEHITYAIKSVTKKVFNAPVPRKYRSDHRLLIDYPQDLKEIRKVCEKHNIMSKPLDEIYEYFTKNRIVLDNKLPQVTVYTSMYNAEKWVFECIKSVLTQKGVSFEYIIIDDCSTDNSLDHVSTYLKSFHTIAKEVLLLTDNTNKGLAARSNQALSLARGKYIIRLDADDYFQNDMVLQEMLEKMMCEEVEALYPSNQFQKGYENHHVGGAMFNTEAMNAVKFNDKLRGYEGYDFFLRSKETLKIGYLNKCTFYYRQHDDSMSKTNLKERQKIKERIECTSTIENTQMYQSKQ